MASAAIIARNAALDAVARLLDGGSIEIRTGATPATPETAATGTLLATHTLSATSAPAAAAGVLTLNAIADDSDIDATGTAGWARAKKSDGSAVLDLTCGASGSGADIIMATTSLVLHGVSQITAGTISMA